MVQTNGIHKESHGGAARQVLIIWLVVAALSITAVYLCALAGVDGRVMDAIEVLLFGVSIVFAALAARCLQGRGALVAWSAAVAMAFITLAAAAALYADWPLNAGFAVQRTQPAAARSDLERAVARMDAPGVELPWRARLTRNGPVHIARVNAMLGLANIAMRDGDREGALEWVKRARSAGEADPGERADLAQLNRWIEELEHQRGP